MSFVNEFSFLTFTSYEVRFKFHESHSAVFWKMTLLSLWVLLVLNTQITQRNTFLTFSSVHTEAGKNVQRLCAAKKNAVLSNRAQWKISVISVKFSLDQNQLPWYNRFSWVLGSERTSLEKHFVWTEKLKITLKDGSEDICYPSSRLHAMCQCSVPKR